MVCLYRCIVAKGFTQSYIKFNKLTRVAASTSFRHRTPSPFVSMALNPICLAKFHHRVRLWYATSTSFRPRPQSGDDGKSISGWSLM